MKQSGGFSLCATPQDCKAISMKCECLASYCILDSLISQPTRSPRLPDTPFPLRPAVPSVPFML